MVRKNSKMQIGGILFPTMKYMGPGNNTSMDLQNGVMPVNLTDVQALKHDIAYMNIKNAKRNGLSKEEADALTRQADKDFIKNVKANLNNGDRFNKIAGIVGITAMKLKNKAEDLGLLNQQRFVGGKRHRSKK